MTEQGRLLARGPWAPEQVESVWRDEMWEPSADVERLADDAVDALRDRGSPAHDGKAARLSAWSDDGETLRLELQPVRWALGAGGAVEVGEDPALTLSRELEEEWQLTPTELTVEALAALPSGLVAIVGLATVPGDADPVPDAEHDEFAWWPADVSRWPGDVDERLRQMASLLAAR
jgi:8-oxo-dGTP diphosphatase